MKTFWKSESGNFAMMTAVLLPVLLAGVGLSIDTAHIVNTKSRLQNIVDSAVLAASRENASDAERRALFNDFVSSQSVNSIIGLPETSLTIDEGLNYIQLTGRIEARIGLLLMDRFGHQEISVSATTLRSTKTLEIAMVLDNTGSMGQAGINALKRASKALLAAIDANGDPRQEVHVGLVPFVTAVNIKAEGFKEEWIDRKGEALYNGWNFISPTMRGARPTQTPQQRRADLSEPVLQDTMAEWAHWDNNLGGCSGTNSSAAARNLRSMCNRVRKYPHHMYLFEQADVAWKGCVEARPMPYNLDLTPPDPSRPDTLFVPYFAPSEPVGRMNNGGNDSQNFNNSWLDHKTRYDLNNMNDERRIAMQRSPIKYMFLDTPQAQRPAKTVREAPNLTLGPNRACPTPLTPLTTDMAKVNAGIDAMQFWNGSGTNIAEGLAWGWRLLSPGEPFAGAAPFGSDSVSKFLVLMTDGTNVSFGSSRTFNKSDYGSYGFLGTPAAGTNGSRIDGAASQGAAETKLNTWTGTMCTNMKAQGIEIYTVIYNTTNAAVRTLFQNCASRPGNFHMANNTAALEAAFAKIGSDVASLHLTH
jgi:Flp pilus assembly protein TadG